MIKAYKFTGEIFICDMVGKRVQPTIIDIKTNKILLPILTHRSKAFSLFMNKRKNRLSDNKEYGFYFMGEYISGWNDYLKNVKIFTSEDFDKYVEYMI